MAVLGATLGAFMAVLNIQIVNASLADIQGVIGAGLGDGGWVSTSYLIAEIVVIPLTGWLAQAFSVRRYLLVGRTIAWAPNEPVEIHDREFGVETSSGFVGSPLQKVMETREPALARPVETDGGFVLRPILAIPAKWSHVFPRLGVKRRPRRHDETGEIDP